MDEWLNDDVAKAILRELTCIVVIDHYTFL